jgi:hypothetical protein
VGNEACWRILAGPQAIANLFGILSSDPSKFLSHKYDHRVLSTPGLSVAPISLSRLPRRPQAQVWPLRDLVATDTEAHTREVVKIIFVVSNNNHSSYQPRTSSAEGFWLLETTRLRLVHRVVDADLPA